MNKPSVCVDIMAKPKQRKQDQEQTPSPPTTPPETPMPTAQAQTAGGSQGVLQMFDLFREECEQKRREDKVRRHAEEQRWDSLVAAVRAQ